LDVVTSEDGSGGTQLTTKLVRRRGEKLNRVDTRGDARQDTEVEIGHHAALGRGQHAAAIQGRGIANADGDAAWIHELALVVEGHAFRFTAGFNGGDGERRRVEAKDCIPPLDGTGGHGDGEREGEFRLARSHEDGTEGKGRVWRVSAQEDGVLGKGN
jgi:hypothetical protein